VGKKDEATQIEVATFPTGSEVFSTASSVQLSVNSQTQTVEK